jgi:hypothetical protein
MELLRYLSLLPALINPEAHIPTEHLSPCFHSSTPPLFALVVSFCVSAFACGYDFMTWFYAANYIYDFPSRNFSTLGSCSLENPPAPLPHHGKIQAHANQLLNVLGLKTEPLLLVISFLQKTTVQRAVPVQKYTEDQISDDRTDELSKPEFMYTMARRNSLKILASANRISITLCGRRCGMTNL